MNDAPGCFGSAIAFSNDSQTCRSCNFKMDCSEKAEAGLLLLAEQLNVNAIRKNMNPKKPEVKRVVTTNTVQSATVAIAGEVSIQPVSEQLSPKAEKLVASIKKRQIDMNRMKLGKNPFALEKPMYMKLACAFLVGTKGFTDKDLEDVLIRGGEASSESEAKSLVSLIKEVFGWFEVAEHDGTWWRLK